jgi:hypothetical protein
MLSQLHSVSGPFTAKVYSLAEESSVLETLRKAGSEWEFTVARAEPGTHYGPCNACVRGQIRAILGPPVTLHDWRSPRAAQTHCSRRCGGGECPQFFNLVHIGMGC